MPLKDSKDFAWKVLEHLRLMGLADPATSGFRRAKDLIFEDDSLGGKCVKIGRWKTRGLSICVYTDRYFGSSDYCWVALGAKNASLFDPIVNGREKGTFVELLPDDWEENWNSVVEEKKEALRRTSFTVYEDWRPKKGWAWFGRYFLYGEAQAAIEFLDGLIRRNRVTSHAPNGSLKTQGKAEKATRIGQAEFRDRVIEIWGWRCALTGCRLGPALEAAHIKGWAEHDKIRRDPENGIALVSTVHKLLEKGLLSFASDGRLLSKVSETHLGSIGLRPGMRLERPDQSEPVLTKRQKTWMDEHRSRYGFKDDGPHLENPTAQDKTTGRAPA
jgi:hypothetical protein